MKVKLKGNASSRDQRLRGGGADDGERDTWQAAGVTECVRPARKIGLRPWDRASFEPALRRRRFGRASGRSWLLLVILACQLLEFLQ